jgi:hypothetical protein
VYDIIGDIHGYAGTLEALLLKLGYTKETGYYSHKKRKAIFMGDFIDRGPAIRECLQIVRTMVDRGSAMAVMGNHEYNAICYNTPCKNGEGWLREHSSRNIKQHGATLEAFANYLSEWEASIEWFINLPLYLDLGNLRIVHAFWHTPTIEKVQDRLKGNRLNMDFLNLSCQKDSMEYHWIENILKGFELPLPANITYLDKDGIERSEIRVKWWKQLKDETYQSISVKVDHGMPKIIISAETLATIPIYPTSEVPVFIGHYWNTGKPELLAPNVCCVDYSIAHREKLVAYRWDGEGFLNPQNFVLQECVD